MAALTLVSIDHYFKTNDVEFVDGELREQPAVQWAHARVQSLLLSWFDQHESQWAIIGRPETRTSVPIYVDLAALRARLGRYVTLRSPQRA